MVDYFFTLDASYEEFGSLNCDPYEETLMEIDFIPSVNTRGSLYFNRADTQAIAMLKELGLEVDDQESLAKIALAFKQVTQVLVFSDNFYNRVCSYSR